ncbi:MAG: HAD-IA family hydrolase [Acidimicrobiia bacterium]|nr:HAD-IA family hydrolase [Acidimicrobiia bacterium]
MSGYRACLIDVYDTLLSCDFRVHATEMPVFAGVEARSWNEAFIQHGDALNDGQLTMGEAYAAVLRTCGKDHDDELIERLRARDLELLFEHTVVHPDSVPFLEELRERGVRTAIVSNCADGTRPLLHHLGLDALVDELVLSCEVRSSKPAAPIFETALTGLGATPEETVFVDDQPAYCDGARRLGITAVCIRRDDPPVAGEEHIVRSLEEVIPLF